MASGQNVEPRSRGAHVALTGPRPAAALRTEILIPLSVERVWLPIATRRRPSCPGNTDTEVSPMANNDQPTRAHHPHRTCRVGHRDRGPMAANARRGRTIPRNLSRNALCSTRSPPARRRPSPNAPAHVPSDGPVANAPAHHHAASPTAALPPNKENSEKLRETPRHNWRSCGPPRAVGENWHAA